MRWDMQKDLFISDAAQKSKPNTRRGIINISIYTLSDFGVLSNLIGSLSLANEHYSPPTE